MYEFGLLNGCFMTLEAVAGLAIGLLFFICSDYKNSYKDPDYPFWIMTTAVLGSTEFAVSFFILPMLYMTIASRMEIWNKIDLTDMPRHHHVVYAVAYTFAVCACIAYTRFQPVKIKKQLRKKYLRMRGPKLQIIARRTGTY